MSDDPGTDRPAGRTPAPPTEETRAAIEALMDGDSACGTELGISKPPQRAGPCPRPPELTLDHMSAVLTRCVAPVADREDWVVIAVDALPRAWAPSVRAEAVGLGGSRADGPYRLPRAHWELNARLLLEGAQRVVKEQDILALARRGPAPEELGAAPLLEDWRLVRLWPWEPALEGRLAEPPPRCPQTKSFAGLVGLDPARGWARNLQGLVRLGTPAASSGLSEASDGGVRLSLEETEATIARRQARMEKEAADLLQPEDPAERARRRPALLALQRELAVARARWTGDPARAEGLLAAAFRAYGAATPAWLLKREPWLGHERPVDLLDTPERRERMADYLMDAECGALL